PGRRLRGGDRPGDPRPGRPVQHELPAAALLQKRRRRGRGRPGAAPDRRVRPAADRKGGMRMAISVKNVTKRFGDFVALDDVSIDVPDGGLTALLGPSGSGKSTLLRVIAGLEAPDEGQVLISGEDNTETRVQDRNVGFVFQHYAAFKHMTVYDNIAFGLKIRGEGAGTIRERVKQLIELVHLKGFERRFPNHLSGGQRQRMALASRRPAGA